MPCSSCSLADRHCGTKKITLSLKLRPLYGDKKLFCWSLCRKLFVLYLHRFSFVFCGVKICLLKSVNLSFLYSVSDCLLMCLQGVTYCGESSASSLTMANVPWHQEVVTFVQQLADMLPEYEIACEHEHSNCLLIAHTKVITPSKPPKVCTKLHNVAHLKFLTTKEYLIHSYYLFGVSSHHW